MPPADESFIFFCRSFQPHPESTWREEESCSHQWNLRRSCGKYFVLPGGSTVVVHHTATSPSAIIQNRSIEILPSLMPHAHARAAPHTVQRDSVKVLVHDSVIFHLEAVHDPDITAATAQLIRVTTLTELSCQTVSNLDSPSCQI